MSLVHLLIIAAIQGLTEFLPVSSSAHLILLPRLTGQQDQGLALDVAVHVGTLGAVILYFWRDVAAALLGIRDLLGGRRRSPEARLALGLLIATVPVVVVGLPLRISGLDQDLRSVAVIGWTMLLFGLVLWWTDRRGAEIRSEQDWTLRDAALMGLSQALALIPGTSRSGITISAARWLGYQRRDAAKLSMLMSIPTILASGVVLSLDVARGTDPSVARDGLIAAVFAFFAALLALAVMMRLLRSVSFLPYVIYRIALGVLLLAIAYG